MSTTEIKKEETITASVSAPLSVPGTPPEIQEIVDSVDEREIDLSAAIVKAYKLGMKHGKKEKPEIKNSEKPKNKKSCFWCGFDRTCTGCVAEDRNAGT